MTEIKNSLPSRFKVTNLVEEKGNGWNLIYGFGINYLEVELGGAEIY